MAGEGAIGLLFAKGVVLCSSIAAPVGPMALLCLQTTLAFGFVPGLMGGLGVAAGDTFYASLAAFGLQAATAILTGQPLWLGMLGGLYLVWFGVGTMRQPLPEGTRRGLRTFVSTFLLTLANPPTIMIFAAIFATLGLVEAQPDLGGRWRCSGCGRWSALRRRCFSGSGLTLGSYHDPGRPQLADRPDHRAKHPGGKVHLSGSAAAAPASRTTAPAGGRSNPDRITMPATELPIRTQNSRPIWESIAGPPWLPSSAPHHACGTAERMSQSWAQPRGR